MRTETVTLWDGEDFVIVEPGSDADKLWHEKGYGDKAVKAAPKASKPKAAKPKAEKPMAKRTRAKKA